MLGEKGLNLIKALKRSSDTIPEFDDEGVRKVLEEIKILYEENCEQAANYSTSGDRNIWPLLNFRHAALQRNKRCLLVYLNERLEKIKSLRWEFGPVIPTDIKNYLCEPEILYFNNYSKSLANYMRSIGDGFGIDLTSDLKPPKTLYVELSAVSFPAVLNALPQATVDLIHQSYQHNIPGPVQTLNLEGLDYLLRYASSMFDKHLKSQPQTTTSIETAEIDEKLLPPIDDSRGFYMPLYMAYEDDKIDGKTKHLLKISPPEKSNEPNYYSAKPKKLPKKYSSTVKHVNIKREAVPDKTLKEELSATTEFVAPKMSYDWIPIVGTNHKNARENYDIIYGGYDNVDMHPSVPETDNNQQDTVKSKGKKVKSRSRRDVYDILSKNERLQYQMHGFGGPKTYKFGYDTGKGKDRHFRFEERKNDGSIKGEYGFVDDSGKMSVVRYSSNAETGFQVQH